MQLGGVVCDPAPGPSHVGGPACLPNANIEPYLFAGSCEAVPQSVIPEHYAPI